MPISPSIEPSASNAANKSNEPVWYRQFWPWFLIALPTVAVIACFISLGIAIRHGDSSVRDTYTKEGLSISRAQQQDNAALQQQLSAVYTIDGSDGRVGLDLSGRLPQHAALLTLHFIHPFESARDFSVALHDNGNGGNNGTANYSGYLPAAAQGRWTVELCEPSCAVWRLRGVVDLRGAQPFHLRP